MDSAHPIFGQLDNWVQLQMIEAGEKNPGIMCHLAWIQYVEI